MKNIIFIFAVSLAFIKIGFSQNQNEMPKSYLLGTSAIQLEQNTELSKTYELVFKSANFDIIKNKMNRYAKDLVDIEILEEQKKIMIHLKLEERRNWDANRWANYLRKKNN